MTGTGSGKADSLKLPLVSPIIANFITSRQIRDPIRSFLNLSYYFNPIDLSCNKIHIMVLGSA